MAETKRAWYVLRAISGKEAKVKELLDGAIKNTDLGNHVFQVLIPTEKVLTIKNGKKVVKERNLYSGYVFVEAELIGEVVHELVNTTNVIDFLKGRGKDAKPEPLRESEVMRMLGMADDINENLEEGVNDYMVGEIVKVNSGAFSGFNGKAREEETQSHGQDFRPRDSAGVGEFAGRARIKSKLTSPGRRDGITRPVFARRTAAVRKSGKPTRESRERKSLDSPTCFGQPSQVKALRKPGRQWLRIGNGKIQTQFVTPNK